MPFAKSVPVLAVASVAPAPTTIPAFVLVPLVMAENAELLATLHPTVVVFPLPSSQNAVPAAAAALSAASWNTFVFPRLFAVGAAAGMIA